MPGVVAAFTPSLCTPLRSNSTYATNFLFVRDYSQWQLVAVTRGGTATSPNKDFIETSRFPRQHGML